MNQEDINQILSGRNSLSYEGIFREVDSARSTYDDRRKCAAEMFKRPGMEEAIIDELESMGFQVIESS